MSIEKYQFFTSEDFIEDEYFQEWSLQSDSKSDDFWQSFLHTFPQQKKPVQEATQLLQSIHGYFETEIQKVTSSQIKTSFQKVADQIDQPIAKKRSINLKPWILAASILFLLSVGSFYFLQKDSALLQVYSTGNGERLTFLLPDFSEIQLNANSNLRFYPDKWKEADQREVWLNGEAYFEVQKKLTGTKLKVYAGDLEVIVLGTQFNVRARGEKAEVVLTEGKIELAVADQKIEMKPGDFISYSKKESLVESKKVKPSDYYAWKDGIAIFNNELSEVVKELEILYGVQFKIENESLKNRRIQLSAPAESLEELLEILKLLYPEEINVKQNKDQIVIF
ncbi:MAG: transmembrane sensor [Saprospiraceae bacterium]|jgi:transmembrane sensor